MKPKIWNDITNILAKLASSSDYDPKVKYETALEYYGNQIPVLPKPGANDGNKGVYAKADGTYELKNTADANSVHYTEDTGKTDAQKAQARANIGAEPNKFVVTVTDEGETYSADKTFAEITAAISAGKTVIVTDGESIYNCVYCDGISLAEFSNHSVEGGTATLSTILIDDSDACTFEAFFAEPKTKHISYNGSTRTITPEANTVYTCGEMTSLTISNPPATGDYAIKFTSGATPTTAVIPPKPAMRWQTDDNEPPQGFPAANTRYEINVSDTYVVLASWPVPGVTP